MKTLELRFMHLKKQPIAFIFWLVLPAILTIMIIHLVQLTVNDTKIPIALVVQDESNLAKELEAKITSSPLLNLHKTSEEEAISLLEKHELDSVFIINSDYETTVMDNRRNELITGYQSNLSFAYLPVKEQIISYVQRDTGHAKTVQFIHKLQEEYGQANESSWDEIVHKANQIEDSEQLLTSTFKFANETNAPAEKDSFILNPWNIWAIFSVIATFFIFDWVIKERTAFVTKRFAFTKVSFKRYILSHFAFYTVVLMLMDLITYFLFDRFLQETNANMMFILSLISLRMIMNLTAFLLALFINRLVMYYSIAVTLTLFMVITSSVVLPIESILSKFTVLYYLNPIAPFIQNEISLYWIAGLVFLLIIWLFGKENSYA